jgi:hypothetical protein
MIFYTISHTSTKCCVALFLTLDTFLQDTLCLVAAYLFHLEPLEDFDPLTDFDMSGGNDQSYQNGLHNLKYFFVQPVPYWTDGSQGLSYGGFAGVLQHI